MLTEVSRLVLFYFGNTHLVIARGTCPLTGSGGPGNPGCITFARNTLDRPVKPDDDRS
jgi:hypothetical protein